MECKFALFNAVDASEPVELIETLWNVNSFLGVEESQKISELIETLWNVNNNFTEKSGFLTSELIETLWNVNYKVELLILWGTRN